jgi:hypothetical protein
VRDSCNQGFVIKCIEWRLQVQIAFSTEVDLAAIWQS